MPLAMEAATRPGLLDTFKRNNALLEQIMKCLESYLETKRVAFPRFYFLSNDELLDILAQVRINCFFKTFKTTFLFTYSDKKSSRCSTPFAQMLRCHIKIRIRRKRCGR